MLKPELAYQCSEKCIMSMRKTQCLVALLKSIINTTMLSRCETLDMGMFFFFLFVSCTLFISWMARKMENQLTAPSECVTLSNIL